MSEQQVGTKKRILSIALSSIAVVVTICAIVIISYTLKNNRTPTPIDQTGITNTETDNTTVNLPPKPQPIVPESTATITITGDILPHIPVMNSALDKTTGTYNFDKIFTHVNSYISVADYAVANLEVPLRGTEDGNEYTGYPRFNCPDAIATSLKTAGFDLCLTSNNHCFDKGLKGLNRTIQVLADNGLENIGTMPTADAPKYLVKEINGIRIGMVCYTFETGDAYPDRPSINGLLTSVDSIGQINSFDYNQLDKFYGEMEQHIAGMKEEGADAVILYIHWGNEYQFSPTNAQKTIAQKMCDLGVDIIVGGHPHVIQPMELLTATTDPEQKTVCLYSTGNAVSNQRRSLMNLKTGHTEDGIMISFSFTKYSDGTVALERTEVLPTWVRLFKENGKNVYNILPLDKTISDWKTAFNLTETDLGHAQSSYERTMALVSEGLAEVQTYLESEKNSRQQVFDEIYQGELKEYQGKIQ